MKTGLSRSLTALLGAAMLLSGALAYAGSKAEADPVGKLRAGIEKDVADPSRAATMLAAVDEIEATVGELTPFMQRASELRRLEQGKILDRLFELRETLTPEEWGALLDGMK